MADVFISYSRLDRERVKALAERLASLGYSVWWEQPERAGVNLAEERARELEAARAVLAVWSTNGRDAAEVGADAAAALDAGKLLQVRLEQIPLPPPFDRLAKSDLTGATEWGPLEQSLANLVKNGEANASAPKLRLGLAPTLAASGAPKLLMIATACVLAAFAGALGARFNGVMTADQAQFALVGLLAVAGASAGLAAHRLFTLFRAAA